MYVSIVARDSSHLPEKNQLLEYPLAILQLSGLSSLARSSLSGDSGFFP